MSELVQQITPAILKWIAAQAQAGHQPGAVLNVMLRSGWTEHAARQAIAQSKHGKVGEPPEAISVPEPNLSSWMRRTPDRTIEVVATAELPRLAVFGNVLSDEECDSLIELARPGLKRSATVDNWSGGDELNSLRTSEGACFVMGESELLRRIEVRIAALLNWPMENGEGLQVLRYGAGAEYQPHHDYFDPSIPGAAVALQRGGPRVATLIMYLNTPARGGSTTFPDVGFQVAPIKGRAVFFSYDCPHPSTCTLHGGAPVLEGEKWVATKWLRAGAFT